MLLVLQHDRARVPVGKRVLIAQPIDPLVEAQKARTLLYLVEPLWEPAAGDLRNPLDEVAVSLLGVVHGHERLHERPNSQRSMSSECSQLGGRGKPFGVLRVAR